MISKQRQFWLAGALAGLTLATAHAEPNAESLQIQVLSAACINCHNSLNPTASAVPNIAGRPAGVLQSKLLKFKRGEDPEATVMPRHAAGYTDDELAALADYFSKLGR